MFNHWINSQDVRILFLYDRKSDHNAAVTTRKVNSAFGDQCTIQRWLSKLEFGDESLTNEDQCRPETVVGNEVLRAIFEQNPSNTFRNYAEELGKPLEPFPVT
ncbi:hypothetical protein TNIN_160241 [Trichonephila inaurata madagascariensis]|uniref:Transposase n=1 Tax=Trichonephila inaurata madagascariensis TaxID=2747483 RepID=A0A8X7CNL7_9ARAC|nr:hypothetical protein TNIN_160241 [Trichonephila inaurata madagascariensis]